MNYERTGFAGARTSLLGYAGYLITEGLDNTNDGAYYEDTYWTWCPDYGAERTGSVTATNGSTTVTGSSTQFQSQWACNGTDTIAIQDSGGFRRGYTVVSCASQTSMTIATPYAGSTESGRRILKYAGVNTTPPSACHNSYGTVPIDISASRTLNHGILWLFPWIAREYSDPSYNTVGDLFFAQALGLDGPGNDGLVGFYADILSGGTPPDYLVFSKFGKEYGTVGGAAGTQSFLADRLGNPIPVTTTSKTFQFKRSAIPNATQARITITLPSGATVTNTCSADTCTVSGIDTRQGNGQYVIEYLSAGNGVLSTGQPKRVTIP